MEYYIVMNEWKYPEDTGKVFVGDFDEYMDAQYASKTECAKELHNFEIILNDLAFLSELHGDNEGYILDPCDINKEYYFRSVIIKREVI